MKATKLPFLLIVLTTILSASSCDKLTNLDLFGDGTELLKDFQDKQHDELFAGWWLDVHNVRYLYFDCDKGTVFSNSNKLPDINSAPEGESDTHWYTMSGKIYIYHGSVISPDYSETITYESIEEDPFIIYRKDEFSGRLVSWLRKVNW